MTTENQCPCGSDKNFVLCCQRFISHENLPQTAEELMRSRYVAYVLNDSVYLMETTHSNSRKFYDPAAIEKWASENAWQKLKIVATQKGLKNHSEGIVEFKAYFIDPNGQSKVHHERSNFVKEKQKWYFLKGKVYL